MSEKPTYEELEERIVELEESKAFFENILDMLPELVSYIDKNHTFKFGNRAYREFFNIDPALMKGRHPREVLGDEAFQEVAPKHKAALSGQEQEYESTFLLPNGEPYYFSAHYLPHEKDGRINGFLAVVQDLAQRKKSEEALRESEKEFKDLFDNAPLGYVEYDQEGRIRRVNQTYLDMLGYQREEMLGEFVWDFYVEKSEAQEQIAAKLEGRKPPGREFTRSCRRKDGSVMPVLVEDRLLMDSEKGILRIRSSYQDITERKRAENAIFEKASELRKRNQFIQTILDNLPIGLAINYFDEGTATYINRRFEEIYGWPEEELSSVSTFFEKVYPDPDYRQKIQTRVLADINSGDPGRMQWDNLEATQKNGSKRFISAKNIPIFEQNFMISTVQDVTDRIKAEKALQESILRQNEAIKAGNVGLWDWDLQTNKVTYSREWKQQIGYEEDEISDDFEEWQSRVHPDDLKSTLNRVNQSIADGNPSHRTEFRFRHKDGSYRWILAQASILKDENGDPARMLGAHVDITERKQNEESLKRTKAILDAAGRMAKVGGWELDAATRAVTWTDETYRIHEVSPGYRPTLKRAINYFHPEERPKLEQAIRRALDHGEAYDMEIRFVTARGRQLWTRTRCQPEIKDGKTVKLTGIFQDITSRKRAEEALLESEKRFRELVEMLPEAVFETDANLNLKFVNQIVYEITGYTEKDVENGLNGIHMLAPASREKAKKDLLRRIEGKQVGTIEYTGLKKDGSTYPVLLNATPVLKEGSIIGFRGVLMDITNLKEIEERLRQAQKMESIGKLAGGIAHEFNNVLGIILGNAELAIDEVPDWNPAKESLKEIRSASFRAKDVVRQILSFARKTTTALKPLEINTIVKESLKLMRASIPTMVDIQANIPSETRMILGDPTEIHQIVINLCTNAAHAMKTSGGILEVGISEVTLNAGTASRYEDLSAGDFVKLTVKDSGEGISPDVLERVFEPYFTTKEFGAGSGMGLSVVYGIVKKCKGAIYIDSTVGEGTTVEVLFSKIEGNAPVEKIEKRELPTGGERILLVDDEPSIAKMIRHMLEHFGYTVMAMTDSAATLALFKSAPDDFDLVISDMAMPNMSGDQLAAELIKVREDIPILLCTGHSDTIDEKRAKQMGIRGFAMKPLDKDKLARAVRAVLDG